MSFAHRETTERRRIRLVLKPLTKGGSLCSARSRQGRRSRERAGRSALAIEADAASLGVAS